MASSSFRDSMNSLGWSRREPAATIPATTSNSSTPFLGKLQSLNPFGQGGYVRLPLYENEGPGAPLPARTRREEEEGWFARTCLSFVSFLAEIITSIHPRRHRIIWCTRGHIAPTQSTPTRAKGALPAYPNDHARVPAFPDMSCLGL
jgi:hypothetical protein